MAAVAAPPQPASAPPSYGTQARLAPASSRVDMLGRNRLTGFGVAAGISGLAGAGIGATMPRFPVSASEALIVMTFAAAVGFVAGFALRSRWAMLIAPLASMLLFHFGRLVSNVHGPTIDGVHLDTTYGIVAFGLGFVVPGMLALMPMLVGTSLGAALGRHTAGDLPRTTGAAGRAWLYIRRSVTISIALSLVALGVAIAQPASTPAVRGADGNPIRGSIASLEPVQLGGHEQWIMIHAADPGKPVLLHLSGGPGQSDMAFTRTLFEDLAQDFVVVDWDQRGAGKSYSALDPTSTLTPDQLVSDTIDLTNYLRQRFAAHKIYLTGESWGTTLGVLAVQRAPDLYYAFIASGQMVSQLETDRRLYSDVLALAARTGDDALAAKMRAYGEPPYNDVFAMAFVMQQYDALYQPYDPPAAYIERGSTANLGPWGVLGSEYNLIEKLNVLRGAIEMNSVVYPQLERGEGLDFRRDVPRLEVPYYMLDGQAELTSRRDLALEWYAQLDAPIRRVFSFENSAHSVSLEEFQAFHRILVESIVPETYFDQ
jgi:proline iminopeptidase